MKKILILCILIINGCGAAAPCKDPANVNSAQCVATSAVVDCTTPAAINAVVEFAPVVLSLIARLTGSDGVVDWQALSASISSLGIGDASCILATIGADLAKPKRALPTAAKTAETFNAGFTDWKKGKLPEGVTIKLPPTR